MSEVKIADDCGSQSEAAMEVAHQLGAIEPTSDVGVTAVDDEEDREVGTITGAVDEKGISTRNDQEEAVDKVLRKVSTGLIGTTGDDQIPPPLADADFRSPEAEEEALIKSLQDQGPVEVSLRPQLTDENSFKPIREEAVPVSVTAEADQAPVTNVPVPAPEPVHSSEPINSAPDPAAPKIAPGLDFQALVMNLDPKQKLAIQTALNAQTAPHFSIYAQQQHPGDVPQQQCLILQLQEQHFLQYMQQLYQMQQQQIQQMHQQQLAQHQQLLEQQQQLVSTSAQHCGSEPGSDSSTSTEKDLIDGKDVGENGGHESSVTSSEELATTGLVLESQPLAHSEEGTGTESEAPLDGEKEEDRESQGEDEYQVAEIAAASMWTRKDIREFKDALKASGDLESMINVGHGETVTIRVPTHPEGSCLFWEFATDSYDLGFGLYFEWTNSESEVSVHVSESSDEESDTESTIKPVDAEKSPPCDEIIPVYRRDCNEDVYCGSHVYPGQGVYLLKFDNSYSLWRSKNLFYRVYYTR